MKKKLSLLLLALFLLCVSSHSQTRRITTPKTSSATTVKKPSLVTTAKYELSAKYVHISDDVIYYVEKGNNNAVMAINRQSGEVATVIPGIAGIYEGARQRIYSVRTCSGKLLFVYDKGGVYIYDGKSVETSKFISHSYDFKMVGKHHALLETDSEINQLWLWDMDNMKVIAKFPRLRSFDHDLDYTPVAIDDAGNIWARRGLEFIRITPNGTKTLYDLSTASYVKNERENHTRVNHDVVKKKGEYLYMAYGRRIYRINMTTPTGWEEYAKIPPTEDKMFDNFAVDKQGNILTCGNGLSNKNYNSEFYAVGAFDSPRALGAQIPTGIGNGKIWMNLCKANADNDGNFVLMSEDGLAIYLYNPNGLVGYNRARGTIIKLK